MAHVVAAGLLIALVGAYVATIVHRRGVLTEGVATKSIEDPAELGLSPAVCGWVLRGFRVTADDFVATLLDLVRRRVIELGVSSDKADTSWIPLAGVPQAVIDENDYVLVLHPEHARDLEPHEDVLVHVMFSMVAQARGALSLGDIRTFARRHPAEYNSALEIFAGAIEQAAARSGVHRPNPIILWPVFTPLALGLGLLGTLIAGPILYFGAGLVFGIFVIVDTRRAVVPGPTSRAAYRGCVALRRHLLEVGRMKEKSVASVEIWGVYLAYAAAFGIADKVGATIEVPHSFVTGAYALGLLSPFEEPTIMPVDASAVALLPDVDVESDPEREGPVVPLLMPHGSHGVRGSRGQDA